MYISFIFIFSALQSHAYVTQRKYKKFQRFTQKWLAEHVSEQAQQQCMDWLLGKTVPNSSNSSANWTLKTKVIPQTDVKRTPFRVYNRYKVTFSGSVNSCADVASGNSGVAGASRVAGSNSSSSSSGNAPVAATHTTTTATNTAHCNSIAQSQTTSNAATLITVGQSNVDSGVQVSASVAALTTPTTLTSTTEAYKLATGSSNNGTSSNSNRQLES